MHKIGLIGCSKWAKVVSNEINKNNKFILQSVVCRKNNSFFSEKKSINIYKSFDLMFRQENLDCVYVAANPQTNIQVFDKIKNKKMPVILEKPLTNNYKECLNIVNFLKKNKFPVFTNLPNIYSENFSKLNDFITKNKEKIIKLIIYEGGYGPFNGSIHPILDWGIHPLTLILKLFNKDKILKIDNKFLKKNNSDKTGLISKIKIYFNSNINVKIVTGNLFKKKVRLLKIFLRNGDILSCNFINHSIYINNNLVHNSQKTPLQSLLNAFSDNLKKNYMENDFQNILISADSIKIFNDYY